MTLQATFSVPSTKGPVELTVRGGSSFVFIGANGAGKTRLGVMIDRELSQKKIEVHRISAHRSLSLNPDVVPPSLEIATKRLRFGHDQGNSDYKVGYRWQGKPEINLLSDFDHLLSALYAENNEVSVVYRQAQISAPSAAPPPKAKLDKLKTIWESILPHRTLVVGSGNIKTRTNDAESTEYSASEMSDGERVIFYVIAQSLLAQSDAILIFDEPELHVNKSILNRLWDEIESARPDCAFIYITHDVEFAGSRHAASRYVVRSYRKSAGEVWDIEEVPESSDIPPDVIATILGSRRPVLFVEGDGGSLDSSLYRRVYSNFTVIPVGSCDHVIHTVASFAARSELHHVGCAGLVDADGRTTEEKTFLEKKGVYRLPVSEVENLLLLPKCFFALAAQLKFEQAEAQAKFIFLQNYVFSQASQQLDQICLRYTKRRVDAEMKKIGLLSTDIVALDAELKGAASRIDAQAIFRDISTELTAAIASRNYEQVLLYFDNKGLLSEMARQFGYGQKTLEQFVGRLLRSDSPSELHLALKEYLPTVVPLP